MKNKILYSVQSIAILVVLTMLFSLIFASLYYFNMISTQTFHILNHIFGVICYGAGGFWLGKNIEKKALLHALIVVILLAILSVFLLEKTLMNIFILLLKLSCYLIVCLFMFTKKQKA